MEGSTRGLRQWPRWFVGDAPLPRGRVGWSGVAIAIVLAGIVGSMVAEGGTVLARPAAAAATTTTTLALPVSALSPPSTAALPYTAASPKVAGNPSSKSTTTPSTSLHPGHHLHRGQAKVKKKSRAPSTSN